MMRVCGADFSGAKSARLSYVIGSLNARVLRIETLATCDDRLDLYAAIVSSDAFWGIDCPLALPQAAYARLGVAGWAAMLEKVTRLTRQAFLDELGEQFEGFEGKCQTPSAFCRQTDVAVNAHSALKRVNPSLRAMTYAGLKLLAYVRRTGVRAYPFDAYDPTGTAVCEVYPSKTWALLGLSRSPNLEEFLARFEALDLVRVELPKRLRQFGNQDDADSVVACITLAAALIQDDLTDWGRPPSFCRPEEWDARHEEGLIVRLNQRSD